LVVIVIADILKSDGGTRAGRRRPPLEAPRRREPKETTEERWRQCGEAAARGGGPGGSVMFTDCSDPHTLVVFGRLPSRSSSGTGDNVTPGSAT